MNPHRISKILLLAICLSLIAACGTFEIGIERTPTPTESAATMTATTDASPTARSEICSSPRTSLLSA